MKKIRIGKSEVLAPNIAVGCMRIADMQNLPEYLSFCIENGLNFFDLKCYQSKIVKLI